MNESTEALDAFRPSMREMLRWGTLHQIWFVLDYYMLKFQDGDGITVFSSSYIENEDSDKLHHGQPGFCDRLVSLINSKIVDVTYVHKEDLMLKFDNGQTLTVQLTEDEAFELSNFVYFS